MYPNSFDNIFDKVDNFFHSSGSHKEINVPEEEFLENNIYKTIMRKMKNT